MGCSWAKQLLQRVFGSNDVVDGIPSLEEWFSRWVPNGTGRGTGSKHRWYLCMVVCWMIWRARCTLVFQNTTPSMDFLTQETHRIVVEMQGLNNSMPAVESHRSTHPWRRPLQGTITINTDAAWNTSTKQGGIEVIATDHEGTVQDGWLGKAVGAPAEDIEARAVLEGVQLARRNGWQNVVIKSNVAPIINHIRRTDFSWTIDTIFSNVSELARAFTSVDWLARQASSRLCLTDWVSRPPTPLFQLILANSQCNRTTLRIE